MISDSDLADPTKPRGGAEGGSWGRITLWLGIEGGPSPTLFTEDTRKM